VRENGYIDTQLSKLNRIGVNDQELIQRARIRLLNREVEGQLNIEAIAEQAEAMLPSTVSEQPVSDDWRRKFFLEAEHICDKDLQLLWGKVLAGEVGSPGSYSLRTLEVLKHLSKHEAELFRIFCNMSFRDGWMVKVDGDINRILEPYGLNFNSILMMRNAGLIYEGDTLMRDWSRFDKLTSMVLENNGILLQLSGAPFINQMIPMMPFTQAGRELQNLIEYNPCIPYLQSTALFFRSKGLTVKKGNITSTETGASIITFEEEF
jgi:hypothetical protein